MSMRNMCVRTYVQSIFIPTTDFITLRSIQERYGSPETVRSKPSVYGTAPKHEAIYVNETDFETYVQQFPIDDSIAECFASTNSAAPKAETKYVTVSASKQSNRPNPQNIGLF